MGPTLRRIERRIRCVLGEHELVLNTVPADVEKEQPARIRLRCLHCPMVTPGWEQGRPAYRRTYGPDVAAMTLDNPILTALIVQEQAAEPMTAAGGGAVRNPANVTKFPVAKKRRSR